MNLRNNDCNSDSLMWSAIQLCLGKPSRNGIFGLRFIFNIEDSRENITTNGAKYLEFNRVLNMEFETPYGIEVSLPRQPRCLHFRVTPFQLDSILVVYLFQLFTFTKSPAMWISCFHYSSV